MGSPTVRTFAAIPLPDSIRQPIDALTARLRSGGAQASWVRREHMHLTLRFFGEIDPNQQVPRLAGLLAEACSHASPFLLHVRATGAFPNTRKPSVIWAGLDPLDGPLAILQAAVENAARAIGLPPDDKTFHPHITLARIRDPRSARSLLYALQNESAFDAGAFLVRNVTLFSSELAPQGPIYRVVREFPL